MSECSIIVKLFCWYLIFWEKRSTPQSCDELFYVAFFIGKSSPRPDFVRRPSPGCNLILQKWSLGLTLSIGVLLMSNYGNVFCVTCFNLRLSSCWFGGNLPGAFEDKNTTLYWFSCCPMRSVGNAWMSCTIPLSILSKGRWVWAAPTICFQRLYAWGLICELMILELYHPLLLCLWMSLNRGRGFVTLKYCHLESSVWELSSLMINLPFIQKRGHLEAQKMSHFFSPPKIQACACMIFKNAWQACGWVVSSLGIHLKCWEQTHQFNERTVFDYHI